MSPRRYIDVTLPFIGKIPMTRVGISLLSLVIVAGVALGIYVKVYRDPEVLLINAQEANKQLREANDEYGRHMMTDPVKHEMFEDADGRMALRVFADHCVLIQRTTRHGVRTKLIMDLAREGGPTAAGLQWFVPLEAEALVPYLPLEAPQTACARGCLNPHPGDFHSWYGARDGCWIEVWRQWPDGCTHVQMFNTCSPGGYWDSNQDGSPKIRWTCCVH